MQTHRSNDRRWHALVLLLTAQFMVLIDLTIVTIAMPSIQASLHFSRASLQWVLGAYMLTFGGCLLLGGRASDVFGRRRVFMTGLVIFGLGTLWCGLAGNSGELVAARALQGIGGALFSPAALALLTVTFSEAGERVRAMSLWSAVAAAGGATGLVAGGLLTTGPGWRWVFWVNLPLVVAALALAPRLLSESGPADDGHRHLDIAGAVIVTAGLSSLIYGLTEVAMPGTGWPHFAIPIAVGGVLLIAFAVVEKGTAFPLVPFAFFTRRLPTMANWVMMAFAAAVIAMNYFVSLYIQQVLLFSPLEAGLSFVPMAASTVLVSQIAARLLPRAGMRNVLLTGLIAGAGALFWFGLLPARGSYLADILGPAILLGASGGFIIVAVMTAAVSGVSPSEAGLAGGLINTSQQLGGALGLAALASLAAWHTADLGGGVNPGAAALTAGFRLGLNTAAILIVLVAVIAGVVARDRTQVAPLPATGEAEVVALTGDRSE